MSLQTTISPSHPLEISYQVQLSWPEYPVPFYLSPIITVLTSLNTNTYVNLTTFAPPYSYDYLDHIFSHQENLPAAPIFARHLEQHYFRFRDSLLMCTENLTDPWLEPVNEAVPVNKSINSTSLMVMVCVPTGFVFVMVIILLGPMNF